jgi:hypothetical protein
MALIATRTISVEAQPEIAYATSLSDAETLHPEAVSMGLGATVPPPLRALTIARGVFVDQIVDQIKTAIKRFGCRVASPADGAGVSTAGESLNVNTTTPKRANFKVIQNGLLSRTINPKVINYYSPSGLVPSLGLT